MKAAAAGASAAALGAAPALFNTAALAQEPVTLIVAHAWDISFMADNPDIQISNINNTWAAANQLPEILYVQWQPHLPLGARRSVD